MGRFVVASMTNASRLDALTRLNDPKTKQNQNYDTEVIVHAEPHKLVPEIGLHSRASIQQVP